MKNKTGRRMRFCLFGFQNENLVLKPLLSSNPTNKEVSFVSKYLFCVCARSTELSSLIVFVSLPIVFCEAMNNEISVLLSFRD